MPASSARSSGAGPASRSFSQRSPLMRSKLLLRTSMSLASGTHCSKPMAGRSCSRLKSLMA
eukprot:2354176-Pyramimonas_sp.AAC.1